MRMVIAAVMLIAASIQSSAQNDVQVTIMGVTKSSCGTWSTARVSKRSTTMEFWVIGFLSGSNWSSAGANSILGEKVTDFLAEPDAQGIFGWLDNYCRAHPLDAFSDGVVALITELRARAQTTR